MDEIHEALNHVYEHERDRFPSASTNAPSWTLFELNIAFMKAENELGNHYGGWKGYAIEDEQGNSVCLFCFLFQRMKIHLGAEVLDE